MTICWMVTPRLSGLDLDLSGNAGLRRRPRDLGGRRRRNRVEPLDERSSVKPGQDFARGSDGCAGLGHLRL